MLGLGLGQGSVVRVFKRRVIKWLAGMGWARNGGGRCGGYGSGQGWDGGGVSLSFLSVFTMEGVVCFTSVLSCCGWFC